MKDKRQRMALTWPYANPHLAAYMFAAAATAAAYGQVGQPAAMYWNRAAAVAVAATAPTSTPSYPSPAQPYHQHLMIRPPTAAPGDFLNSAHVPDTSAMLESMGRHSASSACCTSPMCQSCPSPPNSSPLAHSPTSLGFKPLLASSSPEMNAKKLFQPYKNDLEK